MIEIDGSFGEGGGQLLRTALSLSCITGKPFRIRNIRRARAKPGLMHQHLLAVRAAAGISDAETSGDTLGSLTLTFVPGQVKPGRYSFDVGTAGSVSLVLQTLIPPLLFAGMPSSVTVHGGTHVPFSPSCHYLAGIFAHVLGLLGGMIRLELDRCGFYPRGGGMVHCHVAHTKSLAPLKVEKRGDLVQIVGCSAVGNLPCSIAERQRLAAVHRLRSALGNEVPENIELRNVPTCGQGTFIFLKGEYEHAVAGFTALGARGKPAEEVGAEAAAAFLLHHATGMPVDPYLADQLVPYLALARGPSVYGTSCISSHLETNLHLTGRFLSIRTELTGKTGGPGIVRIVPGRS